MTDQHEQGEFHDDVEAWLESSVAVIHEPTLASGLEPDFFVDTPLDSFVVEVENGVGPSELYNGLGQCLVYSEQTGRRPVLVLPSGHGYDGPWSYGPVQVVMV